MSCSKSSSNQIKKKNTIDNYLKKTMELYNIPGLALAVIERDKVIYKNYKKSITLNKKTNTIIMFT